MSSYDDFMHEAIDAGTKFVATLDSSKQVMLIGHFDTDGLCATAIMESALHDQGLSVTTMNFPNLDGGNLDLIASQHPEIVFFVDFGANKLTEIQEKLSGSTIYVLDHHETLQDSGVPSSDKLVHLNPFLHDLTERNTISGAGVTYYFTLGMNPKNRKYAHLGVIGAIGDTQENNGFEELNNRILQHAIIQKTVSVGKRLRLYGINSRPLLKVLEYSTDLDIPGVTNNPDGVKRLLSDLRIRYEWKGRLKKFYHLRDFEKEALTEKILELKTGSDISHVLVPSYTLTQERRRELQDIRECATIINSCGRLADYRTGIDALLGNDTAKQKAIMNLRIYKTAIRDALKSIEQDEAPIIRQDGLILVNFKATLKSSLVGIVASILARNKHYPKGTVICTMARLNDMRTKISLRISEDQGAQNLQDVLAEISELIGASFGGHANAAGAVIEQNQEEQFIEELTKRLAK